MCHVIMVHRMRELIDTCWDVNSIEDLIKITGALELIDTCWDVNY